MERLFICFLDIYVKRNSSTDAPSAEGEGDDAKGSGFGKGVLL